MNKIAKTIGCVALAAVMGVSLAGCGGYKPKETQGITDKYIYVGNTAATTGAYATVGEPFNYGLNAALYAYNSKGGFGEKGLQVVLKHYDDEYDGAKGSTYTEKLVESDKVFALVGHYGTNTVGATLDYVKKIGIPTVYAVTGISDLYDANAQGKNGCVYPVQPIYDTEGEVLLARAISTEYGLGGTKIGVISTTDDAGVGMLRGIERQYAKFTAQQKQQYPLTKVSGDIAATDFSAQIGTLKEANVDVVILATGGTALSNIMASMSNANLNAKCITSYINASAEVLGDLATKGYINNSTRQMYTTAWVDTTNYDETYNGNALTAPVAGWTRYSSTSEPAEAIRNEAGDIALGECYIVATGENTYDYYYKNTTGVWYKATKLAEAPDVSGFGEPTVPKNNLGNVFLYNESWMDASTGDFYTHIWAAFSEDYFEFYDAIVAYNATQGHIADAYTYNVGNSYAIAGYIAGRTFLQGLERVDESGKALNWTNYREALESAPVKVAMGGTVDFANGQRVGVQDLGLNSVVYQDAVGEDPSDPTYKPAGYTLTVEDVIRPLNEIWTGIVE